MRGGRGAARSAGKVTERDETAGTSGMNDIPTRASAVIVGAGIVGNGLACHLARLGWRDIVLVDKGPMPNPGGSTGHASNFIFPIEYSKMMMELTRDSTEQYQALGVFTESGGIEVARTRRADGGIAPPRLGGPGVGHPRAAPLAGRGGQAGPLPGRVGHPRRAVLSDRRRGRLAARRDAHARGGPAARRAARCWPVPRCSASIRHPAAGRAAPSPPCGRPRATSAPRSALSAVVSGARGSPGWQARVSRSPRSCTR